MEHTASIERPFLTATTPIALRRAFAGVSTAGWLLLVQAACYLMRGFVGYSSGLGDLVTSLALLAAVAGIYHGLRWSRRGNPVRGTNCAVVNMVALLFWTSQAFVSQIPLFR